MHEPTILCPNCRTEVKLTESLAAPLLEATRLDFEKRLAERDAGIAKREATLQQQVAQLEKAKESVDDMVAEKLKAERTRLQAEATKNAKLLLGADLDSKQRELSEMQEVLKERDKKLAEAQKTQADFMVKQRALDDEKREMELTIEKRINVSLSTTREQAKKEAGEELKLTLLEREKKIADMSKQIDDLKQKAEQGSQQLQGEVQELELEQALRARFTHDQIEPVPKGEFGGDALQRVCNHSHQPCGTILWESKRTKNWSDLWLAKLREDQRTAKANLAIIVSTALPKEIETFGYVDGIWVTSPRYAIPVASILRETLIELASARQASEGQQSKMELVYRYLTGPNFKQRVEAVVEKLHDMQEDLDKERKTMTKLWAKREQQLSGAEEAIAGMYGDLQGIAGKSLSEISGLEIPLLGGRVERPVVPSCHPSGNHTPCGELSVESGDVGTGKRNS